MKLQAMLLIGLLSLAVGCGDNAVVQNLDSDGSKTSENLSADETAAQTSAAGQNSGDEVESDTGGRAETIEVDARILLAECLASAKTEDRKVLVHFGSPG